MTTNHFRPILVILCFLAGFILLTFLSQITIASIAVDDVIDTDTYLLIKGAFKILYTLISLWLIRKFDLLDLAGLGKLKFKNWFLLIFPLYILLISGPDPGEIDFAAIPAYKYLLLLLYVLLVGFSEEFMIRGFIQSYLIKHFGQTKRKLVLTVMIGAFIFGILHLIKFDKGLYGEISQVLYATFIGSMFGALLLRTNKLWPLVLLHAIIDFFNNFEYAVEENYILNVNRTTTSFKEALIVTLAVLPCFIYTIILLRKVRVEDYHKQKIVLDRK